MLSLSYFAGLYADELRLNINNTRSLPLYKNQISVTVNQFQFWQNTYGLLYTANSAIENLTTNSAINDGIRRQLLGEAYFFRAFFYFYLTNLYGDVPLVLSTDVVKNATLSRSSELLVYEQMVKDLTAAKANLNLNYLGSDLITVSSQRLRPNSLAASALLARVYLYKADFVNAEIETTNVISNTNLYGLETVARAFLSGSKEAIWQLQPVALGWNTPEARTFILPTNGPGTLNPVSLSQSLYSSFEADDLRKSHWIGSRIVGMNTYYYPYKYKSATQNAPITEYSTLLRLAEQYLIRAEARANLNKLVGLNSAQSDINIIRARAGLSGTTAMNHADLLVAIQNERRYEFFTELGHRWFDLKRSGNYKMVMPAEAIIKASIWNDFRILLPLPQGDLLANPNLSQNAGY